MLVVEGSAANSFSADVFCEISLVGPLGYKFSPEFINLVTRCNMLCYTKAGRQMILMNKKEPVDYINIKITWAMPRNVDKGFKLSDRAGADGFPQ